MRRSLQPPIPFPRHGGRREHAGRKPKGAQAGLPHTARPALSARFPVHVTLRLLPHVPNLREDTRLTTLERCFAAGRDRFGFRLVHYSVQGNHIHLLVEACDKRALSRGLQGLTIRIAKGLNKMLGIKGKVFADRYHARILKTPTEVRTVLCYVLGNALHHALRRGASVKGALLDPCSSAGTFDGWASDVRMPSLRPGAPRVVPARSWLLREGWKLRGLIGISDLARSHAAVAS